METTTVDRTSWLYEVWGVRTNSGSGMDKDDGNRNIDDDTKQQPGDLKRTNAGWNALGQTHSITSTALDAFDYTQIAASSKNAHGALVPHHQSQNGSAPVPLINRSDWVVVGGLNTLEFYNERAATSAKANGSGPSHSSNSNAHNRKECGICCDTDAVFASTPPTDKCLHQPQACVSCIGKTIEVAVKSDSKTDNIKCPNCPECFDYEAVLKWADPATFERYNELLLLKVLRKEKGYVECINPGCGSGQVHSGDNVFPIVVCHKCGAQSCFRHRCVWHEGFTCKEWDNRDKRRKKENQLSQEWIDVQTKRCPAERCGRPIQKTDGCDHMTCLPPGGCGQQFCWECLAPYGPIFELGAHMHKATCQYWTADPSNPPVIPPPVVEMTTPANTQPNRHRWMFWRREQTSQTVII